MTFKRRLIIIWALSTWAATQSYQRAYASNGSFSGVSFSFTADHPDFGVPSCPLSFGNVTALDLSGHPIYSGEGRELARQWTRIVAGAAIMPLAPNLYGTATQPCVPVVEQAGEAGEMDGCSVESAQTFGQWYRPTLGVNQSWPLTLNDEDLIEGQWSVGIADFKPAGVQGNLYTVSLLADFVFESCTSQEFELGFRGDAWVFINDTLIVDLGGTNHQDVWQSILLDELDLVDGATYRLRIFLAHRTNGIPATLMIKSRGMTFVPVPQVTIGGSFD